MTNGIALEGNQVIFNLLARIVMDDTCTLGLLLTGQDIVCTIINAITNILGQVEVTVISSNKSITWWVDQSCVHKCIFLSEFVKGLWVRLVLGVWDLSGINLLSLIKILHEYKDIRMVFPPEAQNHDLEQDLLRMPNYRL